MTDVIMKVDQEPSQDRYLVWSTCIDGPTIIGTRLDMLAWLQPPMGGASHNTALRIMRHVDETGTSDQHGRFGWHDLVPAPIGDIAPGDGWYQITRDNIPALVDAIATGDQAAIGRVVVRYA